MFSVMVPLDDKLPDREQAGEVYVNDLVSPISLS